MIPRLALVIALLFAACGGDEDVEVASDDGQRIAETTAPPTTTDARDEPPAIIVADGSSIRRVAGETVEHIGDVEGAIAVAFGDGSGSYAAEVDGALIVLLSGPPAMGVDPGPHGRVVLYDLLQLDGRPHALYGVREDDGEPSGPILLHDLPSAERRKLGSGFAAEHHTATASLRQGILVTSATADLTESVEIRRIDGRADPEAWTPTRDLEYNAPPFVSDAVLGPDASTVAWLSGPDFDGRTNASDVGTWEVVVADLDGNERHRMSLDVDDGVPVRLDYDGARLLVSREGAPALLIDLADGSERDLPVAGVATFEG